MSRDEPQVVPMSGSPGALDEPYQPPSASRRAPHRSSWHVHARQGMLPSAELASLVASRAADAGVIHGRALVVDPVLVTSSGALLVPPAEVCPIARWLFPLAEVVTPNLPEAECLLRSIGGGAANGSGAPPTISDLPSMHRAARALHALGPRCVPFRHPARPTPAVSVHRPLGAALPPLPPTIASSHHPIVPPSRALPCPCACAAGCYSKAVTSRALTTPTASTCSTAAAARCMSSARRASPRATHTAPAVHWRAPSPRCSRVVCHWGPAREPSACK